jgi:transcriptional regulator with XRE-family HTH domain
MMTKKKEPSYEDLSKKYTDEEIAENFVFRSTMSEEEQAEADQEFRKLRFERLKNRSDEQVLHGALLRTKYLMKDYFSQDLFLEEFSFSNQLKKYINLLNKTRADFASDVGIHKTKLSRILNDRENPNIDLMYRLEQHCGKMISATYWYKLHSRKLEEEIKKNEEKRAQEYKKVKNGLKFKLSA